MHCALPTTTPSNVRLRYANRTYNTYRNSAPTCQLRVQLINKFQITASRLYPLQSSNPHSIKSGDCDENFYFGLQLCFARAV
ncbi:MAG: hypothetical protein RI984_1047 [Pseudomonadota bacterium]